MQDVHARFSGACRCTRHDVPTPRWCLHLCMTVYVQVDAGKAGGSSSMDGDGRGVGSLSLQLEALLTWSSGGL